MAKKRKTPSRQKTLAAMQSLYDSLNEAYWAASTIEAKDRIYGTAETVFDILTELEREDLEAGTAKFKELTGKVKRVLGKLDQLKKDVDKMIHSLKVALGVTSAIDKAIQLGSKYFRL